MKGIKACLIALLLMVCAGASAEQDWQAYEVELCAKTYSLPVSVGALEADGWILDEAVRGEALRPNSFTTSVRMKNGDMEVNAQIVNLSIHELPAAQCLVGQISLDEYGAKKGATLSIGGVALGMAGEAVTGLMGEPGSVYEGSIRTTLTYETDSYQYVKVSFDAQTGLITEIIARSFATPEGYNDEALAQPVEVPQSVLAYAEPEALGEDLLSFTIKLDGKLYALPAPVERFAQNGWALQEPSELIWARGICIGMTQDALLGALDGLDCKPYESSSYTSYSLKNRVQQEVEIFVRKETGLVYKISVTNVP